jgi:kynurenine formamidase
MFLSPTKSFTIRLALLCLFSLLHLANCKWIDLSYTFNNETMYWGTSTRFQHKVVFEGQLSANITYYSAYDYSAAEHGGTHLDAPIHFSKGKWSVDDIPPEKLVGEAIVVNISVKSATNRNAQLTVDDLKKWEDEHGTIPKGSILFVFNDWGKHWPSYEKYFGTSTKNASLYSFPGILMIRKC